MGQSDLYHFLIVETTYFWVVIRFARILFLTGALSYLGFTVNQFYTVVHFYVNQDEIAATLCVNKEVENSKCQGHCQLKSELKLPSDQEVNTESNQSIRSGLIVFQSTQDISTFKFLAHSIKEITEYPVYLAYHSEKATTNLLDPPERIV